MKQVDPNKYNKDYYQRVYGEANFLKNKGYFISRSTPRYEEVINLVKIKRGDTVVDYGCGNGDFAFYVASRYHCEIIAIDYSREAFRICKKKLKQDRNASIKIKFINCGSEHLSDLLNIKAVFFSDVLEHIYDCEVEFVLNKIRTWDYNRSMKVVVRTDNNNYLKFIAPIFNILNLMLRNKSLKQIIIENRKIKELHVNLMTQGALKNKMKKWGYRQIMTKFPSPTNSRIKNQLGKLICIPYLCEICEYILKKCSFLSPSFYAVFIYK